jgi:assimilatory nitrate reductase catalytic subunit
VRQLAATYWPERVERLTGVPEADLVETAHLLGTADRAIVLTGRGPEQQAQGVNNALACINIALALGQVGKRFGGYGTLTGQGNGQGGREHGQKADQLPGYRRIDDPAARRHMAEVWGVAEDTIPKAGKSAFELLDSLGQDGGVRALFVFGSNVLVSAPDARRIEQRLRALDLLVVSDFFLSETAALADVVLPSAQWAEEEGTTTNLEGRVVLRRRAVKPPGNVRTDLEMLVDISARLGKSRWFPSARPVDVFNELRDASRGGLADYSGITHQRIAAEDGVFWPCPALDHPGTPRLFADSFPLPEGRARFHAVLHQPPDEDRDVDYPLHLTTGRVLAHYQSGTQTRRSATLRDLAPEPLAEIHPQTARRFGFSDSASVTLTTRRGSARFTLKLSRAIREDTVFVPFHWGGVQSINRLTNAALDPISRMPEFKVCAVRAEACVETTSAIARVEEAPA